MPNIYKTKTLIGAVEQVLPVRSFLRDTFFPHSSDQALPTEDVLIDTKKGKRTMAPFVAPRVGGVVMDRQGFTTNKITSPRIAPERILTIDDISTRGFGENLYSTKSPEQRQAELIGKDIKELSVMIDRREEYMIRELLINRKIPVKGFIDMDNKNKVEMIIDYGEGLDYAITHKWNTAEADIFKDIKDMKISIIKESGVTPTVLVVANDVIDLMLENEKFAKLLDNRRISVGSVAADNGTSNGTIYWGNVLGLKIYSYEEWFVDDDDNEQPMIPEGTILMSGVNLGQVKYGLVTQLEDGVFKSYIGTKVPKTFDDETNDIKKLRITSRPVPVPDFIDSWIVTKVV